MTIWRDTTVDSQCQLWRERARGSREREKRERERVMTFLSHVNSEALAYTKSDLPLAFSSSSI
jgi:hypothetical protein